jgi:hypothetical protein
MALALLLVACKKEKPPVPVTPEKIFTLSGFSRIHAGETFHLTVKQGASYSVIAKGLGEDLNDLVATLEQGNILSLRYNSVKPGRGKVDIEITLPVLTWFHLLDLATGEATGFGGQNSILKIILAGEARCTVNQLPSLVDAYLGANSELTLAGKSGDLIASLLANAKLDAYNATFDDADVYTAAHATAKVAVLKSLAAFASDQSRIYYKGSPASVNIEESDLAKVIRE